MDRRDRGAPNTGRGNTQENFKQRQGKDDQPARPSPVTLWTKHLVPPIIPLE